MKNQENTACGIRNYLEIGGLCARRGGLLHTKWWRGGLQSLGGVFGLSMPHLLLVGWSSRFTIFSAPRRHAASATDIQTLSRSCAAVP